MNNNKRKWYVRVVSPTNEFVDDDEIIIVPDIPVNSNDNDSNDTPEFENVPVDNMISDWNYLYVLSDNKLFKVDFNTDLTMTRYTDRLLILMYIFWDIGNICFF